jgi:hypothetical protein
LSDADRIDLSPLDPERDPAQWERFVQRTVDRVAPVLAERRSAVPLVVIAGWVKPLLIAAVLLLALLIPAEIALEARETRREQVKRLVTLSAWAPTAPAPTGVEFVRALSERMRP